MSIEQKRQPWQISRSPAALLATSEDLIPSTNALVDQISQTIGTAMTMNSPNFIFSILTFTGLIFTVATGTALAAEPQTVRLDGHSGGKRFDGIGVVDGGGGTSVLLKDYPEPQRQQILDLVYKPKFGASVSNLYVEIPGDGNSTQGSMPSHAHSRDDLNYGRGYTWWVMQEAKRRNPDLTLDGAVWSAPGWIGGADTGTNPDQAFWSQDGADYYVSWLKGLRTIYHLELAAIGPRNESGVDYGFVKRLRATLDKGGFAHVKIHCCDNWPDDSKFGFVADLAGDPELRKAIAILSSHNNPPKSVTSPQVLAAAAAMDKPLWNTEQHVYKPGFDGLISTVQAFNENYIRSGYTKIVDWYGIGGLYTMEPYSGESEATVRANWPWSGHYEINEKLWAYAHYGQFSSVGWTYLRGGSGDLKAGGTYVTLVSPQRDYSVIIETKDAAVAQTVRFSVSGLSKGTLAVWRSTEAQQFVRQPDQKPVGGAVTLRLDPHAVYSLTTTRGQRKGGFNPVPDNHAFPFPYADNFDGYGDGKGWGYLPHYFADISGAFELAPCPGRAGQCLHQGAPVAPISWGPDWTPYTIIGDERWHDYAVSVDVHLAAGQSAAVMGRINTVGTGYGFIPKGYLLTVSAKGDIKLSAIRGKSDKKRLVGDAEQQAAISASNDDSEGGEKVLGTAHINAVADQWHRFTLQFENTHLTGLIDGKTVVIADDALYATGMAGLLATTVGRTVSTPYFDAFAIGAPGAAPPATSSGGQAQHPIYSTH